MSKLGEQKSSSCCVCGTGGNACGLHTAVTRRRVLRLAGTKEPHEQFALHHHHRKRDAVPVAYWPPGQKVTTIDVSLSDEPRMSIVTGTVVDNLNVPPSGGCAILVKWRPDGPLDVLNYPLVHNHHHVTFFGDHRQELLDFCRLAKIQPVVV